MDKFDRIYSLHKILINTRYPISRGEIQARLECSRATFSRLVEDLRDFLGAPIEYNRKYNGYFYAKTGEHPYELPGLWFNASELYALLTCQTLLKNVQPGLLDESLSPLKRRIEEILASQRLASGDINNHIRIIKITNRKPDSAIFQIVASATLQRKRLNIVYHGRERNQETSREVSPQRLTHYRDNWYMDAWCHLRNELRSFAIDRVKSAHMNGRKAKSVKDPDLDDYLASAYGIFGGRAKETAVLRFSPAVSPWVSKETWHPKQNGRFVNGSYELEIPYSDPRELVMDILRYGADVEVIKPDKLRKAIAEKLRDALEKYL